MYEANTHELKWIATSGEGCTLLLTQLRTMDLIPDDIKRERNIAVGISPGRTSKSVKCRTSRSQFEEIPFHKDEDMGITYRPSGRYSTLLNCVYRIKASLIMRPLTNRGSPGYSRAVCGASCHWLIIL